MISTPASLRSEHWMLSTGIGGRFRLESLEDFAGIRTCSLGRAERRFFRYDLMMSHAGRTNLWKFIIDNSLLLVVGTVSALLWANLDHTSYEHFVHVLHFPVNDIGMAFFFALAMKEIVEAMLPG